jgi:carboxyl-terminal processing protease
MSRTAKIVVVSLSLLVFSYAGLGYVLGKTDDDKAYRSLTVYSEVLQRVQEDYVDEPNMSVVTAGALHGLLESLDPYSGYLSPREYSDYKDKQKNPVRGEIGATIAKRFGYIVVISVLSDSPAEKASLRTGDILEAIAGFTTRDMSVGQATLLLNGAPASSVKLAVVRRGTTEPQSVDVTRAVLAPQHVTATKLGDDVAYVRLPTLDAGMSAELRDKLQQMDRQGLHKLVLDLRDCAHGPISEGVSAAQLFLSSGKIATVKGQTVASQDFQSAADKVVWKNPMEVLISDSTSGAAEVVASALADNHRAGLVGWRTFGSASEQKMIPLEDGSALLLTVAYYYTPAGKPILDEGVPPTAEVLPAPPDTSDNAVAPGPPAANQAPPADDPVLRKALDLLKTETRKAA